MSTIKMTPMGEVTFIENGRVVTDPSEITYIKRHTDWKSTVYRLSQSLLNEIESEINKNVSIHKSVPKIISENEIQSNISSLVCKEYKIEAYVKASFQEINNNAVREANRYAMVNSLLLPFYKRNKGKKKIAATKLQEFIDFYSDRDAELELRYYEKEKLLKAVKDKEYKEEYEFKKNSLMRIILNNEADINIQLNDALNSLCSFIPKISVSGSYNKGLNCTCLINIKLPNIDCIESRKGNMLQSGKISVKNRSEKEIKQDWEICCYGIVLYVAGVVFNVNTSIQSVTINAQYSEINKITGRKEEHDFTNCSFERSSFEIINWNNIDPVLTVNASSIGSPSSGSKSKKTTSTRTNSRTKKRKYEIKDIDEITGMSLDIIFSALGSLVDKYSISIFENQNKSRLLGAVKDILPKNEAEQELLIICIENGFFELLLDNSKKDDATNLFEEIANDNDIKNYQGFLNSMASLL